jgi:hypothetical protein
MPFRRRRSVRYPPMTTPTPEEQRFHWSEGNRYALEAMKALLWLNGVSAFDDPSRR